MTEVRQALLPMKRHGVIDLAADVLGLQMADQLIPLILGHTDDILIEYVSPVRPDDRPMQEMSQMMLLDQGVVTASHPLAGLDPVFDVRQLHAQQGGL